MERQQQYVGIDLPRHRSLIVRMTEEGEVLSTVQIDNDPLAAQMNRSGARFWVSDPVSSHSVIGRLAADLAFRPVA